MSSGTDVGPGVQFTFNSKVVFSAVRDMCHSSMQPLRNHVTMDLAFGYCHTGADLGTFRFSRVKC